MTRTKRSGGGSLKTPTAMGLAPGTWAPLVFWPRWTVLSFGSEPAVSHFQACFSEPRRGSPIRQRATLRGHVLPRQMGSPRPWARRGDGGRVSPVRTAGSHVN